MFCQYNPMTNHWRCGEKNNYLSSVYIETTLYSKIYIKETINVKSKQ